MSINEAKKAGGDVPVGAIIVLGDKVIGQSSNKKEFSNDVTAHAEILAIKQAAKTLDNWRLTGAKMFVTLEPCPMCATAIINSRISELYFGAYDTQYGAFGSVIDMREILPSNLKVYGGINEAECSELIDEFFKEKRK